MDPNVFSTDGIVYFDQSLVNVAGAYNMQNICYGLSPNGEPFMIHPYYEYAHNEGNYVMSAEALESPPASYNYISPGLYVPPVAVYPTSFPGFEVDTFSEDVFPVIQYFVQPVDCSASVNVQNSFVENTSTEMPHGGCGASTQFAEPAADTGITAESAPLSEAGLGGYTANNSDCGNNDQQYAQLDSHESLVFPSIAENSGIPRLPPDEYAQQYAQLDSHESLVFPSIAENSGIPRLLPDEVERLRAQLEIYVSGVDIPAPWPRFQHTMLPRCFIEEMISQGCKKPTSIQAQTWPLLFSGRSLVGIAANGSGKKLALMLPALVNVSKQYHLECGKGPFVVVLVPSRDVGEQLQELMNTYTRDALPTVRHIGVYSDEAKLLQKTKLERGPEVIFAMPERMKYFLEKGIVNIERCSYLALYQIDKMFAQGFEQELRFVFEHVMHGSWYVPIQLSIWSTTWSGAVKRLAKDMLAESYVQVSIGTADLPENLIRFSVDIIDKDEKRDKLFEVLEKILPPRNAEAASNKRVLIYVLSKNEISVLIRLLEAAKYKVVGMHSEVLLSARKAAFYDLMNGEAEVLILTEVDLMDLHFNERLYVVVYDYPLHMKTLLNRVAKISQNPAGIVVYIFFVSWNKSQRTAHLMSLLEEAQQEPPPELLAIAKKQAIQHAAGVQRFQTSKQSNFGPL